MLVIRLARGGRKGAPFHFIVIADSRAPRDGKFVQKIGFYNPSNGNVHEKFRIDAERLDYWIKVGAKPTPTVKRLVRSNNKPT